MCDEKLVEIVRRMKLEELDEQQKRQEFIHMIRAAAQKERAEGEAIGMEKGKVQALT